MAPRELASLVQPAWLIRRLRDPRLRIVDASWYLPDAGRDAAKEFEAGHVPGSIFVDLARDLADLDAPVRNTLLEPAGLAHAFGRLGVSSEHQVVVYDRLGGYSAGRVVWALRVAGHPRCGLLDGGYPAWTAAGGPIETGPGLLVAPAEFAPQPARAGLASRDQVLELVRSGAANIVDARSPERFRGEGEEPAPRSGHIPGARNLPWNENLSGDPPRLRSPAELRALYEARGVRFDRAVVTSCGSGVTASLSALALELAGHPDVSVYDGSWAEWAADPELPIETGP